MPADRTSREEIDGFGLPAAPSAPPPLLRAGGWFWLAVVLLALVFSLGVVGFIWRWQGGWQDRSAWGYYAATLSFLLSTAQTAPAVSIGLRLAAGQWRLPLARPAELFALVGVLNLLWLFPLWKVVPPTQGRRTIWFEWPLAPHLWDTIALATLVVCGLALLYLSSLPDMVTARELSPRGRGILGRLGLSWNGSLGQWRGLRVGLLFLGVFYILSLVFGQTLFASDFALSLVPGWKDPLFPTYHVVSALLAATALVTISLFLLRHWGGLKESVGLDTFKGLGRLLLVLTLLWFYFWWSGFIVLWYGRRPEEQLLLQLFISGPNRPLFIMVISLNFVAPFLLLLWNSIRKSIAGPTVAAVLILLGTLLDRIRLFSTSFSVAESGPVLKNLPPARMPDMADLFILCGGLAGMALIYLLATRLLPVLSLWEIAQGKKLESERSLGRWKMRMVAKPD